VSPLPPSPFINSAASFPAAAESAAAGALSPPPAAAEPIPEIFMGGAWHPAHELLAEPNSAGMVMLPTDTGAVGEVAPNAAAPVPIQVSPGVRLSSLPSGESDPSVTLDFAPGGYAAVVSCQGTAAADPQDLIDEIFIGARRLPQRELPADFQERLLAAIESDAVFADPRPLFLQRPR
jgi:hypothetical protein